MLVKDWLAGLVKTQLTLFHFLFEGSLTSCKTHDPSQKQYTK